MPIPVVTAGSTVGGKGSDQRATNQPSHHHRPGRSGSFPILPYDEAAATWHGYERARLESLGKPAPFTDGQIAAIAHANDLVLVTVNVKDFARFKGLKVANWSRS